MTRLRLLCGLSLGVLLLSACGEAEEEPARLNRALGGAKEGAPLGARVHDPGILQEAGSYTPAKLPQPATEAAATPPTAGATPTRRKSDPEAEVAAAVADLVAALQDGEVELALRLFSAEQAKPLLELADVLYATFERIELLERLVAERLGAAKAAQLVGALRAGETEPKWELFGSDRASVTPNVALILFGPAKAGAGMQLARQKSDWRFQMAAPLAEADVNAIKTYHEGLQAALDQLVDWVTAEETPAEAQLKTELGRALQGQPLSLGEAGAAEKPEPPAEPKAGPPRGRRP
jgi:hypothetical protein